MYNKVSVRSQKQRGDVCSEVQLLTQLVRGRDYVSGDARVQIGVHDAERVQLGHMVTSDLQEVTTAQSPPRTERRRRRSEEDRTNEGGGGGEGNKMQRNTRRRGGEREAG